MRKINTIYVVISLLSMTWFFDADSMKSQVTEHMMIHNPIESAISDVK